MYNGCMGVFDPRPGGADSVAPGKAFHLCPSICSATAPLLVIGAPGGTQIAMGVLQAILNVIDFEVHGRGGVGPAFLGNQQSVDVATEFRGQPRGRWKPPATPSCQRQTFGFAAVHGKIDNGAAGRRRPRHDGIAVAV